MNIAKEDTLTLGRSLVKDVEFSKYPKALATLTDTELQEEFDYKLGLRWDLPGLLVILSEMTRRDHQMNSNTKKDNLALLLIKDVEFSKYPKALETLTDAELKEEFKYRLDLRWELSGLAGAKQSKFAFAAMDEMKKRGI